MQTIETYLNDILETAFKKCGFDTSYAMAKTSARPDLAQFQCNGAMPLAKVHKKAPFLLAEEIINAIDDTSMFEKIEVVKPGFINITMTDTILAAFSNKTKSETQFGYQHPSNSRTVIFDFGGPNVAKPMHVGHIRSSLIGDALQRLYRYCGDHVISDVHLGDWGTQMGMLIEIIKEKQPNLPYFDDQEHDAYPETSPVTVDELSILYPEASLACKEDPAKMEAARQATADLQNGHKGYRALWQHFVAISIEALKVDFGRLDVNFDLWYGESDAFPYIEKMITDLKASNHAEPSDGALVIPFAGEEQPPLILQKSDGAVMYGTTDLATIIQRKSDFNVDEILYVVDKRQALHFKQVFDAAKQTNIAEDTYLEHVGFGTVNGKDGKPYKTRSGSVMRLRTLIDEALQKASEKYAEKSDTSLDNKDSIIQDIAMAAIKFADLSNIRTTDYIFDLDKFSQFEGKTGPYLLYSAVRIKSMLRKAALNEKTEIMAPTDEAERQLVLRLLQFPNAIQRAYEKKEPHHLCDQAYLLAQSFSKFYTDCPILNHEDDQVRASRLALSNKVLAQLEVLLTILGIKIPEQM